MVTDKDGYAHLIQYLTEHLGLFEAIGDKIATSETVLELFEEQLSAQVIMVCGQNPLLSFEQRNMIIREIDAVIYDLEEILGAVAQHPTTVNQSLFISEFSGLIKNLFDQEIEYQLSQ